MNQLEQACHDILYKNMEYTSEQVYLLYDTESPLAQLLSGAYQSILPVGARVREFKNPPQPLYRGGMINPENPHANKQNRVITSHNIDENIKTGLDHHQTLDVSDEKVLETDNQIESIKTELTSLPQGSIVILVQSTNFRLSTFRIRLELFHRGIHVVEHNHLAYIPESQFDTFFDALRYRTDDYTQFERHFSRLSQDAKTTRIQSVNGDILTFGALENIRGNTGEYIGLENKGGTFPIGEAFTEAIDLSTVDGTCLIDTFPREDFSIAIVPPFRITIKEGRVLPSRDFPPDFQRLYDLIAQYEGEVLVRELGFGLNPAISTERPLHDINFHERKVGVHLSLGKKHGIYGKKLPKTEVQRFHVDIFVVLDSVYIGEHQVFENGSWKKES